MQQPPAPEIKRLLSEAVEYDDRGDVYTAVKLYKKVVRHLPAWFLPYRLLGLLYKKRGEWKPALYYSGRAVAYKPDDRVTWQIQATAATALRQWRQARHAWNQLGYHFRDSNRSLNLEMGAIPVSLHFNDRREIVWATQIDPARARIESVPQPSSGFRWRQEVLLDYEPVGTIVVERRRLNVRRVLESLRYSEYSTWLLVLHDVGSEALDILDQLCLHADIGYDNWSKSSRQVGAGQSRAEFFDPAFLPTAEQRGEVQIIGLAARQVADIEEVLSNWKVITFEHPAGLYPL